MIFSMFKGSFGAFYGHFMAYLRPVLWADMSVYGMFKGWF